MGKMCNHVKIKGNKYAFHAYTHGPVTGSGPSGLSSMMWLPIG